MADACRGEAKEMMPMMKNRLPLFASVVVFGAALLGMAPTAKGQAAPLPPTWKVNVVADASAKADGRKDFVEYIYIDGATFTGDQIYRLGMVQTGLSVTSSATPGTYNVSCSLSSHTQGDASFTGTINNTTMSGTISWTIGAKTYTYTYTGVPFTADPNPES
jgi:hypothetical protein